MENSPITWLLMVIVVVFLLWSFTRRKSGGSNVQMVLGLMENVQDCLKTIDIRLADPQSKKKFSDTYWRAFGKKTGFLSSDLGATLNEAFSMANDFNQRIEIARKNHTLSTLQALPVERLRAHLLKAKEGLSTWMKTEGKDEANNHTRFMGL